MIWNSSIFWGIIGLVGGGIISSIFYFLGLKRKILTYEITTTTLISNSSSQLENLNIEYNNTKIHTLYSSIIKLQNTGNTIIEKNDFATNKPLGITTKGNFILNKNNEIKQIISPKNNDVYCTINNNEINSSHLNALISYDYFSKKESISITVFHTDQIDISGKFKDGKLIRKNNSFRQKIHFLTKKLFFIIVVFLICGSIVYIIERNTIKATLSAYEEAIQLLEEIISSEIKSSPIKLN